MATETSAGGIISNFSDILGTSENALRLLVSVLAGYPLALLHRKCLYGKSELQQHVFFAVAGLALAYWNCGYEALHSFFAALFTYLTLMLMGGTAAGVAVTFLFNMSYLLIGYYYAATDSYDINWTTPYCVLVLRLIGLSYDLYDGRQPSGELSAENKKSALITKPTILEFLGYCFFPASSLIGPQFPLRRYQDFVAGKHSEEGKTNVPPSTCIPAALQRLALACLYLAMFQTLGFIVWDDYILTDDFAAANFFKRALLLGAWGRYTLYKYITCWLFAEGACILFGLSYNGTDASGKARWDGLVNVDLWKLENATEFNHYIQSFNINTNHWVGQYVYKRLKFLGNRYVSQGAALLFLAIWHGFHSGYYVCFLFEFLVMYMEKDLQSILKTNEKATNFLSQPPIKLLIYVLLRLYTFVFMGWCLIPFALLTTERYWKVYGAVNYMGIVFFGLYPFIYGPILTVLLKKKRQQQATKEE